MLRCLPCRERPTAALSCCTALNILGACPISSTYVPDSYQTTGSADLLAHIRQCAMQVPYIRWRARLLTSLLRTGWSSERSTSFSRLSRPGGPPPAACGCRVGYSDLLESGLTFGDHLASAVVQAINKLRRSQGYTRFIGDTASLISNVFAKRFQGFSERCH